LLFTSFNSYNLPLTVASIEFDHFYCPKLTLTPSSNQYRTTLHYEEQHPYDGTTILLDTDQSLWIHLHEIVYNVYTTNARLLVVCILSFPPLFLSPGCAALARNAACFAFKDYAALTSTEEVLGQWNMEVQGLPASLNSNTWD
jgi:hypothetical protein